MIGLVNITDFMGARIDEDEAAARAVPAGPWCVVADPHGEGRAWEFWVEAPPPPAGTRRADQGDPDDPVFITSTEGPGLARYHARFDPARVLAECEAKRRIVALHPEVLTICQACGEPYPCRTIEALAAVYADHPDYDEAWRT